MKQKQMFAALFFVVMMAFAAYTSIGDAKPKETTVKGEIVDLHCYCDKGERGASHKECGVSCVKGGGPMGIVDEKGTIYLVIAGEGKENGRDALIEKMSETVSVTGKVVKKGGLTALYVSAVK